MVATPLCAGESSSVSASSSASQALWAADAQVFEEFNGKHLVLAFGQLGYTPYSMTFDSMGDFWGTWCTDPSMNPKLGLIFELTQSQIQKIEQRSTVEPVTEFANPKSPPANLSFDCPAAIQFDQSGNLWVANKGGGTGQASIMEYTVSQIESAGPHASPTFYTSPEFAAILDMKFDASGNLWLAATGVPQDNNGGIFEIPSDQLTATGAVQAVVTPHLMVTSSALDAPSSLAFDLGGNLWAPGGGSTVLLFAASDLGGSGTVSATPMVTLSSSKRKNGNYTFFNPSGLAVDDAGDLWVSSAKNGGGPKKQDGAVSQFESSEITTSGSPESSLYAEGKPVTKHPAELTMGPQL